MNFFSSIRPLAVCLALGACVTSATAEYVEYDAVGVPRLFKAAAAGGAVRAKQAWTDVGRFSEWGIDAVSCGPGIPAQAHQKEEYATIGAMTRSAVLFERFLQEVRDVS